MDDFDFEEDLAFEEDLLIMQDLGECPDGNV